MQFELVSVGAIVVLFVAMVGAQLFGRRLGEKHLAGAGADEKNTYGAVEGAVFALLGLFLAFMFSGAGARFDDRRHLVVEETNAIGTAWLRVDLLPAEAQPEVRRMFRDYVDARLEAYRLAGRGQPIDAAREHYLLLQSEIWAASVRGAKASGETPPAMLLLPALNAMFDITTTRTAATLIHAPAVVFAMIAFLAIVSAVFVGYGFAGRKVHSLVHEVAFAAVLAIVLYVIIDLEFPRLGLIRVDSIDQLLIDLRSSMN